MTQQMFAKNNYISVLYHGKCSDGFAAAYVFKKRFEYLFPNGIEFIAVHHGEPVPPLAGSIVYLLDFAYPRAEVIALSRKIGKLTILDHHETSQIQLAGIEDELACESYLVFDMSRSGCQLAWDYCYPGEKRPLVLEHIADRDLSHFRLPHTKMVSAYVYTLEHCFTLWDRLMAHASYNFVLEEGERLLNQTLEEVHELYSRTAELVTFCGHRVKVVYAPEKLTSELCCYILQQDPDMAFSIAYFTDDAGKYRFSMRSHDHRTDVRVIAEIFGGGGHRNSAGFRADSLPWMSETHGD